MGEGSVTPYDAKTTTSAIKLGMQLRSVGKELLLERERSLIVWIASDCSGVTYKINNQMEWVHQKIGKLAIQKSLDLDVKQRLVQEQVVAAARQQSMCLQWTWTWHKKKHFQGGSNEFF